MAALPYMQVYIADYLADTMHLTTEEHGAYLLLMFNYWQTGEAIPKNRLAKIARLTNERWISVEDSLKEFFNDDGEKWIHERIERDLDAVRASLEQKSVAGKASAKARKAKKETKPQRDDNERSTGVNNPLEQEANGNSTNKDPDTDLKDKNHLSLGDGEILTDGDILHDPTPSPEPVQPEFIPGVTEPTGKFTMHPAWMPSKDFRRRAGVWNRILDGPDPGYTNAELSRFVTYWQAEGKVFHHVQWEQKFADSVLYERRQALNQKSQGAPNGKSNQETLQHSGESRAMQKFRQATAERHGDDFVQAVAGHGRDLQRPMDSQERGDPYIDLGSDDWSSD